MSEQTKSPDFSNYLNPEGEKEGMLTNCVHMLGYDIDPAEGVEYFVNRASDYISDHFVAFNFCPWCGKDLRDE